MDIVKLISRLRELKVIETILINKEIISKAELQGNNKMVIDLDGTPASEDSDIGLSDMESNPWANKVEQIKQGA